MLFALIVSALATAPGAELRREVQLAADDLAHPELGYESTFVHETAAEEAEKEKKDENPEGVAKAVCDGVSLEAPGKALALLSKTRCESYMLPAVQLIGDLLHKLPTPQLARRCSDSCRDATRPIDCQDCLDKQKA